MKKKSCLRVFDFIKSFEEVEKLLEEKKRERDGKNKWTSLAPQGLFVNFLVMC